MFETARFTDLQYIEKLVFQKVETARLLLPHVYSLLNLNIHFCAFCFYVILLLTWHGAQKFYLLIHVGH